MPIPREKSGDPKGPRDTPWDTPLDTPVFGDVLADRTIAFVRAAFEEKTTPLHKQAPFMGHLTGSCFCIQLCFCLCDQRSESLWPRWYFIPLRTQTFFVQSK